MNSRLALPIIYQMELSSEVQTLLSHINQRINTQGVTSQAKVHLPSNTLSLG